jgi:hypothetical protein
MSRSTSRNNDFDYLQILVSAVQVPAGIPVPFFFLAPPGYGTGREPAPAPSTGRTLYLSVSIYPMARFAKDVKFFTIWPKGTHSRGLGDN